ncbi:MAG: AAA family ATPase [Tepidisphaerales bacterium]
MRLRKLVLHGFKSFADRTEFVFDAPITGIVGPNGCGKSNVVDAIKWVLGEQSAKSLRGDAMMDVIFNGSASRKPGGMAEVVLTFENPLRDDGSGTPRRTLPIDADEVSVGRRLYRDGTSEYVLNQRTARLRDIRELFLDTGIGVDAYSVIEQGRVAQLLEADPQERRQIFEEAAGVSKFKQRKKEAQRKLEKVDQNLLRVTDIVEEVERRLRGVRVQAGRARVYQEHVSRLSELRLQHALREYHLLRTEQLRLAEQLADARFRLDDAAGDLRAAERALDEARESLAGASAHRQKLQYERLEAAGRLEQSRQQQVFSRRQLDELARQLEAARQAAEAAESRASALEGQLDEERARLATLTDELQRRGGEIDRLQEAFRQGQLVLNEVAREQEQHKAAVFEAMRQHAQLSNRLSGIEAERRNLHLLRDRQTQRCGQIDAELGALRDRKLALEAAAAEAAEAIRTCRQEIDATRAESGRLGEHLARLTEHLSGEKEHRSALVGRQRVLQDLERKQQGVGEGVKAVLARRESEFPFVLGLVADVLEVDIEHARVIEAALDGRDQWLVVSSMAETLQHAVTFAGLRDRVNFVSTEPQDVSAFDRRCVVDSATLAAEPSVADAATLTPAAVACPQPSDGPTTFYIRHPSCDLNHYAEELANSPVPVRIALDLVRFEPRFGPMARRLLSRVAVVDDLLAAEHLRQHGPAGWRYITRNGEVLDTDGTFHAGPPAAVTGLLTRRSELQQLAVQIGESDARIAGLTAELQGASEQARRVEQRLTDLRNQLYDANARHVELTSQLSQLRDRTASLERERPLIDRELAQLAGQLESLGIEEQSLLERRATTEAQQAAAEAAIEQTATRHRQLSESLRSDGERLAQARVSIAEVQQKHIAARNAEARLSAELSQSQAAAVQARQDLSDLEQRMAAAQAELETAVSTEQRLVRTLAELDEALHGLRQRCDAAAAAVEQATAMLERCRGRHGEAEQAVNQLLLRGNEVNVRLETAIGRARDELSVDLASRYDQLQAEGTLLATVEAQCDWDAVAREIAELREKIQRLGNVNLDAIAEQDELEQRAEFLAREVADLRESKRQLETLIQEINRESAARFMATFERVREHFQSMFRKLFGGGKADLYLESELDSASPQATETPAAATTASSGSAGDGSPETTRPAAVDPLDAGIEIIARPPGKQPVRISQLSGGEKTMTCVALLLSIFKSKPSPFCVLDEVDAALDEANNQRFNQIIHEFLDRSQFIIITHSKKTMTIADQLYGVTQQEQGVSKRVSVRFDQVSAGGRIDPKAIEGPTESAAAGPERPAVAVDVPAVAGRIGPPGRPGVGVQRDVSPGPRTVSVPLEAVGS